VSPVLKEILEALQTGGPWTIVVVLGYVVRYIYVGRENDKDRHAEEKQKLNDRLIAMSEKQNEVLERATANQTLLLEAVNNTTQGPQPLLPPGSGGPGPGRRS
jgi:hypothetical protein